jgi:hypothetical protein
LRSAPACAFTKPFGLAFGPVVSLHRRLSLQLCCPVHRLACASRRTFRPHLPPRRQLAPPTGLPILLSCSRFDLRLPVEPSGLTFNLRRLAPSVDLRFCFAIALGLAPLTDHSASPSALPVSLRRELRFRICLPASPLGLRRLVRPFSLSIGPVDRLAPSTGFRILPSCLTAPLALRDRPSSVTFLPDCRFLDCLHPLALPSVFPSALASGSTADPSVRFELPTQPTVASPVSPLDRSRLSPRLISRNLLRTFQSR